MNDADKKAARKNIYRACREYTGIAERRWGRLMSLGRLSKTDRGQIVAKKEDPRVPDPSNSSRGVNQPEALCCQLAAFLWELGYDMDNVEFDDLGRITAIPVKEGAARPGLTPVAVEFSSKLTAKAKKELEARLKERAAQGYSVWRAPW